MIKKNNKWFTLIEMIFSILILWVILTFGYTSWYKFLNNVENRNMTEKIKFQIEQVINANDVWRWISRNRIKKNTLIFRNNTNFIDNYYYNEIFKIDPVTMVKDSNPTQQFYWMQRITFPKDLEFRFPTTIEGKTILTVPSEWTQRLIVQRIMPKNKLKVFDWNDNNFQVINPNDLKPFEVEDIFLKWPKTLYQWKPLEDNITYYDIIKGTLPEDLLNPEIGVYFHDKKVGRIVIDTKKRKLVYISYFDDYNKTK